eukprot:15343527-Alexandrium_andersonii.AAC.1
MRSGGHRPRQHQQRRGPPGLRPWQGVEAVEDALLRRFPDCCKLRERQARCAARNARAAWLAATPYAAAYDK